MMNMTERARRLQAKGEHEHECDSCGFVRGHANRLFGSVSAHTCSRCGAEQWDKRGWGESRRPQDGYAYA